MKILVPVKRVLDYNIKARAKADGSGVALAGLKMSLNPFDEIALEAAIRLKEAGQATEVVALSCGDAAVQEGLRTALALGADRALWVSSSEELQSLAVAKLLRAVVLREAPTLVICGKQAIDDDANQTGQMLAALLNWGQATNAAEIQLGEGRVDVVRETDGGTETLRLLLPAVITTDLRLNEPRYATLPNIMKARKKPIETLTPEELGVTVTPRLKTLRVQEPPQRPAGIKVDSVAALLARLKNEAKVI
ncbi:electron transfer flavoprotein subunit beta/FixA family protein [Ferrovum sp.]|uniref:electron transfer flavoprotein subunit beta/FixA family protein n=1 Tax=Ferrovum sp. TaxID=2609467 RepID=UPI00261289C6|nr:electron transfer flavoprotein subunit beta/FixA family protein [Ferrovum sp.]